MKLQMIVLQILFLILAISLLLLFYFFFMARGKEQKSITWGVNFSQAQTEFLNIDWKETYTAILDDLGVKNIKLLTNWDWVEGKRDEYYFSDIDWQIQEAKKRNGKVIYVVGMKSGRWPECHLPAWANYLKKNEQQEKILQYIAQVVNRYKHDPTITAWQAENEPLFHFGVCPWYDEGFLKKEVALIKSLDGSRPIIVSESGEQSWWFKAASIGDIVGTTLYRKVWVHITDTHGFYMDIPLSPSSYGFKASIIQRLFGKKVINVELQAEPWFPNVFEGLPLAEQEKQMNVDQFIKNVVYAQHTGLDTFYFWGTEWWYWMKEKQNRPEIWNEAQKLFYTQRK